ncbi:MFS general substrate transporter [Aspergillus heteromorphus CBS 117.55]|uniref:MFS general substrate transporter n=1 Tax=Aspergillus heteromorphus CBS 117.55 TaxID=1448321 RepID=A0A317V1E8_9EURO|nr:MFS general substrate transporter [Aspergillus heteromorphus CBS 117.55]PWY67885.1 MFS general substrate transporter [Aspergillus heteromorphus CBS 117.55]
MSLLQSLHYEITAPASSLSHPAIPSPLHSIPPTPAENLQDPLNGCIERNLTPVAGRTVFQRAPSVQITQSRRLAITVLLLLANLVQMTVNFAGYAGGNRLSDALGAKETYASWIGASYGMTQGTFVLVSGRLGDVFGHRELVLAGGAWLSLCTLISAFCNSFYAFVTMRALAGLGGALVMPNVVAMIASTNPPGRVRNLSLGFFAASAPTGGYFGALFLGAFMEKAEWKWFFVFIAGLGVATFVPLWALSSRELLLDTHGKIDWIGSALGTSSLILFNFVWNQAPSVGWATSYEIALLITSLILFGAFLLWEKSGTDHPIMPLEIFKAPSLLTLLLVVLFNYMAVGTLIWYQILWLEEVWHWSPLHFAVGWTPFVICATGAACLAAWLIPRLDAQWILAIGTVTILISNALMATVPLHQTYWAQIFPSIVLFSFCPDFVYTAAQIIASNSVRRHQQGIAGSMIGTLNLYGNSLGLGFASTIEDQIAQRSGDRITGYRAALYFGVAISAVALVLDICFVRMVKDDREGWHEDDRDISNSDALEMTGHAAATGAEWPAPVERP